MLIFGLELNPSIYRLDCNNAGPSELPCGVHGSAFFFGYAVEAIRETLSASPATN